MSNNGRRDVTIVAPMIMTGVRAPVPAGELTPEDVIRMQRVELLDLGRQVKELRITASTIANAAICLARLLDDHGWPTVIPIWLSEQMAGASITLQKTPEGDIQVSLRERGDVPVDWIGG